MKNITNKTQLTDLSDAPMESLGTLDNEKYSIQALALAAGEVSTIDSVYVLTLVYDQVLGHLRRHAKNLEKNQKWVNRHAISVVFCNRFAELSGISEPSAKVLDAIERCRELAKDPAIE